jgi:YD repeat-containing protein
MGRVKRSTVPTEVNSSWTPSGDDATRGFIWTTQEYDWKGRVTRQINPDGTDKLISYEGCGCAGGQVTTVSGEQLAEGRRRQKIYEDILGRTYKSETLNWNGTVYSTSKTTFNVRDQAVLIRNYSGAETSTVFQDTVVSYDGHGRVKTQHLPQQDANKATIFDYNPDDSLQKKTDARGATSTYTYDNRKLVTRIDYQLPAPPPPPQPTNNYSPSGTFEGVDSNNGNAWGWSFDPDQSSASNTIHFYLDGPMGTGTFIGSISANQTRADVNQANNITGDHGFVFNIPQEYWDGTQHALYAYGMDTGTNIPTLLMGSPKYFTIQDPNPPNCNPSQGELNSCAWGGGSWNYDYCDCDYSGYGYSRLMDPLNRKKYKGNRTKKLKKIKEKKNKKDEPIAALRCNPDDPDCFPDPDPNPTPTPTPPPPSPTNPYGVFETVDTTHQRLKGWALDPNNPNAPVRVIFSINGQEIGSVWANQPRPDVNQSTGVAGNHGFNFDIPRKYLNGQNQTVYAQLVAPAPPPTYLVTIPLSDSPKTFNLTYTAPTATINSSIIFTY